METVITEKILSTEPYMFGIQTSTHGAYCKLIRSVNQKMGWPYEKNIYYDRVNENAKLLIDKGLNDPFWPSACTEKKLKSKLDCFRNWMEVFDKTDTNHKIDTRFIRELAKLSLSGNNSISEPIVKPRVKNITLRVKKPQSTEHSESSIYELEPASGSESEPSHFSTSAPAPAPAPAPALLPAPAPVSTPAPAPAPTVDPESEYEMETESESEDDLAAVSKDDWDTAKAVLKKMSSRSGRIGIIALVYSYGYVLRISELYNTVLVDDGVHNFLDLDNCRWTVRMYKGDKSNSTNSRPPRVFDVYAELCDEIKKRCNSKYLLSKSKGSLPYTTCRMPDDWDYHMNCIDLRKSYETWNLQYSNRELDEIKHWNYILGHKPQTVASHYNKKHIYGRPEDRPKPVPRPRNIPQVEQSENIKMITMIAELAKSCPERKFSVMIGNLKLEIT